MFPSHLGFHEAKSANWNESNPWKTHGSPANTWNSGRRAEAGVVTGQFRSERREVRILHVCSPAGTPRLPWIKLTFYFPAKLCWLLARWSPPWYLTWLTAVSTHSDLIKTSMLDQVIVSSWISNILKLYATEDPTPRVRWLRSGRAGNAGKQAPWG